MSEEDDSNLEEDVDVEEMLDVGFSPIRDDSVDSGEVKFEDIKIGFQEEFEEEEHKDLFPGDDSGEPTDEDLIEFLSLGFVTDSFNIESFGNLDLEGILPDSVVRKGDRNFWDGDFYKVRGEAEGVYDVYEGDIKGDYDEGFVNIDDVNVSLKSDGGIMKERSMLEISGFRDEDEEKKREDRRRFWG